MTELGIDTEYTCRVIIDFNLREPIKIYVEKFADDKMFELRIPQGLSENIEIVTLDKE